MSLQGTGHSMSKEYPILIPPALTDSISVYGGVNLMFEASDLFVEAISPGDVFRTEGFSLYGFEDGLVSFDGFSRSRKGMCAVSFWRFTPNV
jgi:hypothetical protein